jgi:hypothetical protein
MVIFETFTGDSATDALYTWEKPNSNLLVRSIILRRDPIVEVI